MVLFIAIIFFIWRVLLFYFAWIGSRILPFEPRFPYSDVFLLPSGLPQWVWSFANFDGVHYLTIAFQGYSAQFTQVFFPMYPLVLGLISTQFHILPIVTGIGLSSVFYLIMLTVFWKLLALDYKTTSIKWILVFTVFFPTSFYFGSLYTESLFMVLVMSSFYFARRKHWWLAGIAGGVASATRLIGIFLLPALLWELYEQNNKNQKSTRFNHYIFYILHSPILYIIPIGALSYAAYLQINFGDALYFWHAQPVFGAERTGSGIILLPQVVWRYLKILLTLSPGREQFWIAGFELFTTFLSIILLYIAHVKKVRLSYLIFSWFAVITPTLTGTFSSMPRYVLAVFPVFIILGMIKSMPVKVLLLLVQLVLLGIFTILFTSGHWVA